MRNNLNLDKWFRRRCHLKYFSSQFWWPLCSVERNHLCNLGRGHYGKPSWEVILNLDQWFRKRCCSKKKFTIAHLEPSAQVR